MSFGAEIKDFINAFSAGSRIQNENARTDLARQKMKIDSDPEMLQLKKDYMKARMQYLKNRGDTGALNQMRAIRMQGMALRNRLLQKQIDVLDHPQAPPGPADDLGGGSGLGAPPSAAPAPQPAPGKQSALDLGGYDVASADDGADTGVDDFEDDVDPTQFAARGGLVRGYRYARGGTVTRMGYDPAPAPKTAIPQEPMQPIVTPEMQASANQWASTPVNAVTGGEGGFMNSGMTNGDMLRMFPGMYGVNRRTPGWAQTGRVSTPAYMPWFQPGRAYAEGGLVDDGEGEDTDPEFEDATTPVSAGGSDTDSDTGAIPVPQQGGRQVASAAPAVPQSQANYDHTEAHEAAQSGLQYARNTLVKQAEDGQGITVDMSAKSRGMTAYYRGAGAASPDEMSAVYKAIDPDHEMSEAERTMAALAHVYQWKLKQNDPAGAQRAAASMLQYYRGMSDRYRALASAAAENGDVNGVLWATAKAYANVPDGADLRFKKDPKGNISYEFVDAETKKTIDRGVATPDQILQWASKGGIPNFDELVLRAGGAGAIAKANADSKPKPPKPALLKDRIAASKQVEEGSADDQALAKLDKDAQAGVKNIASTMYRMNDGMSTADAVNVATGLVDPDNQKYAVKANEDGTATVRLPDKRLVTVSKDVMLQVAAMRGKIDKARRDEYAKKEDAAGARNDVAVARQRAIENNGPKRIQRYEAAKRRFALPTYRDETQPDAQ